MTLAAQHAIAADPIARIQQLERARVGQDVHLVSIGENDSAVKFSWKLDQRPKNSKAKLSDNNSARTFFRPDVPGLYTVRITVRLRNLSDTFTLDVTATEPGPLVNITTIDTSQGSPATVIGSQTYADPNKGTGLHVVAVDRNTLELVSNQSYQINSTQISQMQSYLATLPTDGSVLVLVSLPASAGAIPSTLISPLSTALSPIGGTLPQSWNLGLSNALLRTCWSSMINQCYNSVGSHAPQWDLLATGWSDSLTGWNGSFSAIGVPGMVTGSAWYDDAMQRRTPTANGALTGYLTPGAAVGGGINSSAYVFVFPDQYVTVDTCAGTSCAIQVTGPSLPQSLSCSPTASGMNLMVLDRVTLQTLVCVTATTTAQLYSSMLQAASQWASGHFFVGPYSTNSLSDRIVVIVQSVGTGQMTFSQTASGDAGTALLQTIDQLGGTPETFGPAIGCGGGTLCNAQTSAYAFVGVAGNLPWHGNGVESSPTISTALGISAGSPGSQTGRVRAVLARDRYARYTPTSYDPIGTATLDLASVVYEPPLPWPFTDPTDSNTPAYTCAIQYIADSLGLGAYPDFRSAYPITDIDWAFYQPMFVPYPTPSPSCSGLPSPTNEQYSTVQNGLQSEVRWLGNVNLFIEDLATPFVDTGSGQNTISQVAANIYSTLQPLTSTDSTSTSWSDIFDLTASVGSVFFPNESNALGVLASTGTIALDMMSSSGQGNPAKTIIAEAVQLSTQLYDQTQAHLATLGNLQVILVSDYGKLSAVGNNTATTYKWTNAATTAAIQALNATTQQSVYSAMLPYKWELVQLKPDLKGLFNTSSPDLFCGTYTGASNDNQGPGCPFYNISTTPNLPLSANVLTSWFQLVTGVTGTDTSVKEAWTFSGQPLFDTDSLYAVMPKTVATGALFSTGSNGGAAYPPAWYRSTYNPPQFAQCGGNTGSGCTEQHFMPPPTTETTPPTPLIGPQAAGFTMG
jgi:hypothetical protein